MSGPFILEAKLATILVRVHWSVLLAFPVGWAFGDSFVAGITVFVSFFLLMLAHELGHALVARYLRLHVSHVDIYPFHGACHFMLPSRAIEHYLVAWGGFAPQVILLAIFGVAYIFVIQASSRAIDFLAPPIFVFTWLNLLLLVGNMLPLPKLDGYYAWRLIPAFFNGEARGYFQFRRRSPASMQRRRW